MNQNEITIVDDINVDIQAGMFVTAQLGNSSDSDWSPKATLLLLHTDVVFFGDTQFTGLYKKADGSYWVAQFVTKQSRRRYEGSIDSDEGCDIGIMYCTSSAPVDLHSRSCKYFSATQNERLASALQHHRMKISQLPVSVRYKNGEPIMQVAS